jgi:hypothetical protein
MILPYLAWVWKNFEIKLSSRPTWKFYSLKYIIMASTKLKRKGLRNKMRAIKKQADIKLLNAKPVIRNVDVEAIKKEFAEKQA